MADGLCSSVAVDIETCCWCWAQLIHNSSSLECGVAMSSKIYSTATRVITRCSGYYSYHMNRQMYSSIHEHNLFLNILETDSHSASVKIRLMKILVWRTNWLWRLLAFRFWHRPLFLPASSCRPRPRRMDCYPGFRGHWNLNRRERESNWEE